MLTKRTTFVLGAGAIVPFGFPTGLQLSKTMVEGLQAGGDVFNTLKKYCSVSDNDIATFRLAFFLLWKEFSRRVFGASN